MSINGNWDSRGGGRGLPGICGLPARSGNGEIPEGRFEWFDFGLDGGAEGRTADLQITGDLRDGFWRVNGLVMLPA